MDTPRIETGLALLTTTGGQRVRIYRASASLETRTGLYVIHTWSTGERQRAHNCQYCDELPATLAGRTLERWYASEAGQEAIAAALARVEREDKAYTGQRYAAGDLAAAAAPSLADLDSECNRLFRQLDALKAVGEDSPAPDSLYMQTLARLRRLTDHRLEAAGLEVAAL